MPRVPLSLSYVEYDEGDHLGQFLAYTSLLPFFIAFGLGSVFLHRRELHTLTFLMGIIADEVLNYILKTTIKEPRPEMAGNVRVEYGMPSSHSQFMAFFATYFALFVTFRLKLRERSNVPSWVLHLERLAGYLIPTGLAGVVCFGRVYLGYHTPFQVVCGALVGIVFGIIWFNITHFAFAPVFLFIESSPLARWFLIRDSSHVDDILLFEYEALQKAKKQKQK